MFHNLLNVAGKEEDHDGVLRYLDGILTVKRDAHEERWMRRASFSKTGQQQECAATSTRCWRRPRPTSS